jgi:hypothetical protein
MGESGGISSFFATEGASTKTAMTVKPPPLRKQVDFQTDQGARGFMVGIRPMFGLPTPPCAVAMLRVPGPVVPQQSLSGQ